jgi:hypothetical protein
MFEGDTGEDAPRDRTAREPHREPRLQECLPKEKPLRLPKMSIRLKTDGRHFFFAPGSWSG